MNLADIRNKVLGATSPKWFEDITLNFRHERLNFSQQIKGFSAIWEFVNRESAGWMQMGDDLPEVLKVNKNYIFALAGRLTTFIESYQKEGNQKLSNFWSNQILNIHPGSYLSYSLPVTKFIAHLHQNDPSLVRGAQAYLLEKPDLHNGGQSKTYITGLLLAYEFETQKLGELVGRKKIDWDSSVLQSTANSNYLSNTEQEFNNLVVGFQRKEEEHFKNLSASIQVGESNLKKFISDGESDINTLQAASLEKIAQLEKTYEELLRLKEPAEYWAKRAVKLKSEARWSLGVLISLVLFSGSCLYFLLWKTPEGMLSSFFNDDKSTALRWSIVFITFISLLFIAIRAVSKVMFSAYHLCRDAEERQQLTYVYLALRKDASVEDKDRQLIMQSLFSRADTGLLKDDSGPTMPGIDKMLSR